LIRAKLKISDAGQHQLRQTVGKVGKFSTEEQSALRVDSIEAFEDYWDATIKSKNAFEDDHSHGVGLATQKATSFAASAYDILHDISPILDFVKDLGAPYGSMAIGTVAFFFAVCNP
jgi:hypothetical protein